MKKRNRRLGQVFASGPLSLCTCAASCCSRGMAPTVGPRLAISDVDGRSLTCSLSSVAQTGGARMAGSSPSHDYSRVVATESRNSGWIRQPLVAI
jgi:hypothetical protein